MSNHAARLARLEDVAPRGCALCRTWSPIVLADDDGRDDRPERCPCCGRVVPIRQRVVIVGVPLETL